MLKALEVIASPPRIEQFVSAFNNHQRHPNPCSVRVGIQQTNDPATFYAMDSKVYRIGNDVIAVYDYFEFCRAVMEDEEFPGFRFLRDVKSTNKRLVFSADELARRGAGCNENDELMIGGSYKVVVKRNGEVTDRHVDGSLVDPEKMDYLNGIEEYRSNSGEVLNQWRNTAVYEDGSVKEIFGEEDPQVNLSFTCELSKDLVVVYSKCDTVAILNVDTVAILNVPKRDVNAKRTLQIGGFVAAALNAYVQTPIGREAWENVYQS